MIDSFKSGGKYDGTKLTIFASFAIMVISWVGDQFYSLRVNEAVFCTFAGIVVSGLGFKAYSDKKNGSTENQ